MAGNFTVPALKGKSLKDLETVGASLNKQKETFMQEYKAKAKTVQDAIVVQEKVERDKRNEDPAHVAKHQGVG